VQAHHLTILDMSCIVLLPVWPPRTLNCSNVNSYNKNYNSDNDINLIKVVVTMIIITTIIIMIIIIMIVIIIILLG
jgi:hypothetical protein